MEIVLAKSKDLKKIQDMYSDIVKHMYDNGITVWNEAYPSEEFELDILNNQLYLLKDRHKLLGAFALYEHAMIEEDLMWKDKKAKAYLINRLGVNVDYLKNGLGQELINRACDLAREMGAKYLRLLVCDVNVPAINLYKKCKFKKVKGIHEEEVRPDYSIFEYGFEMRL